MGNEKTKTNRYVCSVCNKSLLQRRFWNDAEGRVIDTCKTCLCKGVDIRKPDTFLWILKKLDYPYIESVWLNVCKKEFLRDPEVIRDDTILGKYVRLMHVGKYKNYRFKDSAKLNSIKDKKDETGEPIENNNDSIEKELSKKSLDLQTETLVKEAETKRKKSEKDFQVMVDDDTSKKLGASREYYKQVERPEIRLNTPQPFIPPKPEPQPQPQPQTKASKNGVRPVDNMLDTLSDNEQDILDNLTKNEIRQLSLKWGENYYPSDWIKMEQMYNRYSQEFELGVDREETLKNLCKTTIKMNQAIDAGDAATAAKFATMSDQLRKSGAFTEAQKKEEKKDYISSIGQLVSEVERMGGIIPQFDYHFAVEQDKVDITLRDNQTYLMNLVKNEMGLGDLIESYIKKLEESENSLNKQVDSSSSFKNDRDTEDEEFAIQWLNDLEKSVTNDASLQSFFSEEELAEEG